MPEKNRSSMAVWLLSLLIALMAAHALYYYSILPDRMPTHFGFSGEPDAWGSKTVFFLWYFIATVVLAVSHTVAHHVFSRGHTSWLNIPNKKYWLAPERMHETLDYLRRGLLLFGSGTLLFLLDIVHQSFQVALGHAAALSHVWTSAFVYIAFSVAWTAAIYRRFGRTG
ncbi:hypothetical protein CHL67_06905 [Prosthecochloris sp. GSB1]|uniref:DUF1648 domain-containing protein n=1 Tax=Prosthecochloris sp. GSB1 TaxID=281093 RepID=UPI000B8C770C|nr:DUF1648 domain-containing protein [Prosthecochloris sp. GSB1]ASQ90690.1 hypothetical protein CHL67_06905 [Prosthecochloris sp. GSB1]